MPQPIVVSGRQRIVQVDVKDKQIIIPSPVFFVAVEWLRIEENLTISQVKYNGTKMPHSRYSPSIAFLQPHNKRPGVKGNIWELDYRGKWRNPSFSASDLRIAVAVLQ